MVRFSSRSRLLQAIRLAGDLAAAALAFWLAFQIRSRLALPFTSTLLPADRLQFFTSLWPALLVAQATLLYFFGFYDTGPPAARSETLRRLLVVCGTQGALLVAFHFFSDRLFPRSVVLLYVSLDVAALFLWRTTLDRLLEEPERIVLLVGCGPPAREIAASIAQRRWHGLRVAGYVPAPGESAPPPGEADALGAALGTLADVPALLERGVAQDVLMAADAGPWQTALLDRLAQRRPDHTNVLLLPGPFESLVGRMRYRWVHDVPLVEVVRESEWRINWPLKRALDLAAGSVLLALALPAFALVAAVVRFGSEGPVLYRQTRIGRGRRPFVLLKFRTMRVDAETGGEEILAQHGDPRVVPGGALLRRYRLDELPQLFNVLGGSMSMVGPRPERPGFVERYLREVPGYAERFFVAPGISGLAQVNGDYHSSPQNKLRYDLAYVANWSLWLDLSILFRTVKIVLTSRGV
jgi:exopolysaccharide biosynthesis polyprenyl glycosylphosphotransferase